MANRGVVSVRRFQRRDVPQLLALMKMLADYEGYLADFKVTEADLIRFGLGDEPRFTSYVAVTPSRPGKLLGMAVTYVVGWTYDMQPTLVLKELYVLPESRGAGIGRALLEQVRIEGRAINASKISWTVLNGNVDAEQFYSALGGEPDSRWKNWKMSI